jgi:non-ribosomal peptide synthetase component F
VRRLQALLFAAEDVGSTPFSTSHFQPPYAFQNFPRVKPNGLGGTPVRDYWGHTDNVLILEVWEEEKGMSLRFSYEGTVFLEAGVQALGDTMTLLLEQFVGNGDETLRIRDLEYVRKDPWLNSLPDPTPARTHTSLWPLLQAQLRREGTGVGVLCGERRLAGRQLDLLASQLAAGLRPRLSSSNPFVVILLERSEWLVACILGSLKAGAAYVPLDSVTQDERIRAVVRDTGSGLLLTSSLRIPSLSLLLEEEVAAEGLEIRDPESLAKEGQGMRKNDLSSLNPSPPLSSIAYCIYTSGSTGRPKGVLVPVEALTEYLLVCQTLFYASVPAPVQVSVHSGAFDVFGTEVLSPLLAGGTVVLLNDEERVEGAAIGESLLRTSATHLDIPPAHHPPQPHVSYPSLVWLFACGDKVSP